MKNLIQSKKFKIAAGIVGVLLISLISFAVGVGVGFRKARFSYAFSENYERNFAGFPGRPEGPMGFMKEPMHDFSGRGFRNAHGLAGTIISIADNSLVVKDNDNKENTITISNKTVIKDGPVDVNLSDLKPDIRVVVMGRPNDNGTIDADFIRVFPNSLK